MGIRIRRFTWADIGAIAGLHRASEPVDHAGRNADVASLERRWRRPGSQPEKDCLVAEAGGTVVGYALRWVVTGTRQCTVDAVVLPDWRRRGVGRRLLARTVEQARAEGAGSLDMRARDDEPAAMAFCRALGFGQVRVWCRMWLQPLRIPSFSFPAGFGWRYFRPGRDEAAYAEIVNETFADHWGIGRTSAQRVAELVGQPGFDPESIIFATRQAEIVGVCYARYLEREVCGREYSAAHIGPVGVRAACRGQGLARAMMAACLRQCRRQRIQAAELDVDETNASAIHVYGDCGFEHLFRILWYRLDLRDTR